MSSTQAPHPCISYLKRCFGLERWTRRGLWRLAYTLLETIRRTALRGTALGALRLKLLRIGGGVLRGHDYDLTGTTSLP